jgi:hypothetical protein
MVQTINWNNKDAYEIYDPLPWIIRVPYENLNMRLHKLLQAMQGGTVLGKQIAL